MGFRESTLPRLVVRTLLPNKRMQPAFLGVTGSARGRFAQHTPRHPSPAADTRSLDRANGGHTGVFTMRIAIAVFALALISSTCWGVSTLTEISRADVDDYPFRFEVTAEPKADDVVWIRIHVDPREDRATWCVGGTLEVLSDTLRVGSFDLEPKSEGDGSKWIYSFTLSLDCVRASTFTFRDIDCEMPRFDGYVLSLGEYYK
jgi:hypothetical protein